MDEASEESSKVNEDPTPRTPSAPRPVVNKKKQPSKPRNRSSYNHVSQDEDPADFWRKDSQLQHFSILANLALDILIVPMSSAEVERIFSVAGLLSSNRCNRRKGTWLKKKGLLMKNPFYITADDVQSSGVDQ